MSESLLHARHPELDRLYTIWRLLRADNSSPLASTADPDLLSDWQDHLVIVDVDHPSGTICEVYIGAAMVSGVVSSDTVRSAITEVSSSQQPILVEDSIGQNKRYVVLVLPFRDANNGAVRMIVAIYHTPQQSTD